MQTTENEKKAWGGRRAGSGRKKTAAAYVGLNVPEDVLNILNEAAERGIKRTDYIIAAIRHYYRADSTGGNI